jgi:hypothetical protein
MVLAHSYFILLNFTTTQGIFNQNTKLDRRSPNDSHENLENLFYVRGCETHSMLFKLLRYGRGEPCT